MLHRVQLVFLLSLILIISSVFVVEAQDSMAAGDQLLVWVGDGVAAGQHGASNPGELVFLDGAGTITPVMPVTAQASRVLPCGNMATSPDGNTFAFFMGSELGALYLMHGTNEPIVANDQMHALACAGNGTFMYSADSSRFAYIDYDDHVTNSNYRSGWLRIHNTADASEIVSFEAAATFDITESSAVYLRFFEDNLQLAVEAAIILWDGEFEREIATLTAEDNCYYTSATPHFLPDGRIALVMGYRCTVGDGRTQWQFHMVDPESRSATLVASDFAPGQFSIASQTNNIFTSVDGSIIYFTVPDGLTNHTVAIATMNIDDASTNVVIENTAVMPRLRTSPYDMENPAPIFADDGWMIFVKNNANQEAILTAFDLNNPDLPPIELSAGERGDVISMMALTPDHSRVVYVAGRHSGGDNSLFAVDLATGVEFRINRGRYGRGLLSPEGNLVAVENWVIPGEDIDPFLTFTLVDVETSMETVLWEGGEVVDGELTNQQFIYPLSWRR